jgi:hypothetical protein
MNNVRMSVSPKLPFVAAKLQTAGIDFRIAPSAIFGDINYYRDKKNVTPARGDNLLRTGAIRKRR